MTNRSGEIECSICKQRKTKSEFAVPALIRDSLTSQIRHVRDDWEADLPLCYACLNRFRADHVRQLLKEERGELSSLEEQVITSLREQESLAKNINEQFEQRLTFPDHLSDRLAAFGGSWWFMICFTILILVWMLTNTWVLAQHPFDPYPFILLNLILSCLAAIQAPIILMAQNRQEAKDRLRSENDYRVNLKAELEVRLLHAKMDQLLTHQWQRLLEIQELQIEIMEEVADRGPPKTSPRTPVRDDS